jgi:hypothetical protein
MDWMQILSPVIGIVLTTMSVWVLNWLRKYLQEKHGIIVSDEDFAVAKRVVQAVEEKALTGRLEKSKVETAIADLKEARPNMDAASIVRKVDQAVAELPNIGATGKITITCDPPNMSQA